MRRPSAASELARLNFLLAEIYADCVLQAQRRSGVTCELVGCHGQTIYHQGEAAKYLGHNIACTWQIGDGSVLVAARLGIPVVSDFRPADMAAGGLGAPLVPFLDLLVFRHPKRGRIVQNIGGIGNLTAIPAAASPEQVRAFDTGPGNMVIDALCEKLFGTAFDDRGELAAKGNVLGAVLAEQMKHPFFRRKGPRTAGREEFGREYMQQFLKQCGRASKHDVLATATALTARSIAEAVRGLSKRDQLSRFVCLRRRHAQPDADGDDSQRGGRAWLGGVADRRGGSAFTGERGRCFRGARLPELASRAVEYSRSNRGRARGDSGQGELCVGCAIGFCPRALPGALRMRPAEAGCRHRRHADRKLPAQPGSEDRNRCPVGANRRADL